MKTATALTAADRQEMIRDHLRKSFAPSPLPENEALIDTLIETIQALEASGDLAALTQAMVMLSGSVQRVAAGG